MTTKRVYKLSNSLLLINKIPFTPIVICLKFIKEKNRSSPLNIEFLRLLLLSILILSISLISLYKTTLQS